MPDVILHAFNWPYTEIAASADAIAKMGYGAVLFPPPLYSDETSAPWWQRYQPRDYRVIRSQLGNKAQLVEAMEALHRVGVRCYADIVFNHMANEFGARDDPLDFPGKSMAIRYQKESASFDADRLYGNLSESLFDERSFHPASGIVDWTDPNEVADGWLGGLPDLSLTIWVVKQQLACLQALNDLGFDGYRVDAIKHFAEEHIEQVFQHAVLAGKFVFGEILTFNAAENELYLWPVVHESPMAFYDFPLQQTLRAAFSVGGSLSSLVAPAASKNALPWNRSVTFTVTHDVPNNDGFRGMLLDPHDEFLANAYVFGRDGGVPMLYSDHGESTATFPEDCARWQNLWRRDDIQAMLSFHNRMHGLPERLVSSCDHVLAFGRGDRGLVVINKSAEWQRINLEPGVLRAGRYHCSVHGHDMDVGMAPMMVEVPPRQAQLWVRMD
jgi:alpha-amylase